MDTTLGLPNDSNRQKCESCAFVADMSPTWRIDSSLSCCSLETISVQYVVALSMLFNGLPILGFRVLSQELCFLCFVSA